MRKFNSVNELVNTLKPEYPVYCIRSLEIKKSVKFFKDNLVEPYNRGVAKTETYSVTLKQDYSNLLKNAKIDKVINKLPGTGKGLNKIIENTKLTYSFFMFSCSLFS